MMTQCAAVHIKVRKRSLLLGIPLLGLALGACSQEQADSAAGTDTAVHDADVAVASVDEQMAKGEAVFMANCAACHQPDGSGQAGAFPPLAGSDFLKGDRKTVLAATLFGLSGPITVNGVEYDHVMPSLGHMSDADLAAVLTFVFGSWGNDGTVVSAREIAALRIEVGQEEPTPVGTQPEKISE